MKLMKIHRLFAITSATRILTVGALLAPTVALAFENWDVSGSNTLRREYYHDNGVAGSPYPFTGVHYYDELSVNFSNQFDEYHLFRGQLSGLANHSEYRNDENGGELERANLNYSNGNTVLPFRVELGDIYSYFSQRSVQRTLKGLSVEIQPFQSHRINHSILLYSGAGQSEFDDFDFGEDNSSGISWVMEDRTMGALIINLVHNVKEATNASTLNREQTVFSIASETFFNLGGHALGLEAEVAHFKGDHDDVFITGDGQDKSDNGYFAQLKGDAYRKLTYRARIDQYYADFQPYGTSITNDRRSRQLFSGWKFDSGLQIRGRYQWFEDRFDSFNPLGTSLAGVDLSGVLFPQLSKTLNGQIRFFDQRVQDDLNSVDRESRNLDANVNFPLTDIMAATVRFFFQDTEDLIGSGDSKTRQLSLSTSAPFKLWGFSGSWNSGLSVNEVETPSGDSLELSPTVSVSAHKDRHNLRLSYNIVDQNRSDSTTAPDTITRRFNVNYSYRLKQHEVGIDGNYYTRDVELSKDVEANKVAIYWRYNFESKPKKQFTINESYGNDGLNTNNASLLSQLAPNQLFSKVTQQLSQSGVLGVTEIPEGAIYEFSILDDVDLRQRLVVLHREGLTTTSALLIELDNFSTAADIQRDYQDVSANLGKTYGKPETVYEVGEFSDNISNELQSDTFVRIQQWSTDTGVLRLGIPKRLDGEVRIEVQHKSSFPAPGQGRWTIDSVR